MNWARLHRWATTVVGIQLLAWAATGFAFTLFDFRAVHGTDDRAASPVVSMASVRVSPAEVAKSGEVESIKLSAQLGRPVYYVTFKGGREALIDADNGNVLSVDADRAARIATSAHKSSPTAVSVERKTEEDRAVFVVHLGDAHKTEVFVDAASGDVTDWHNASWRRFDLLWSIHVLGYLDRKSPANWPLRIVGFLAAVATFSGAALIVRRFRRKSWLATKLQRSVSV